MVNCASNNNKRILVVEDNLALQFGLRMGLEAEGYEVVASRDGADLVSLTAKVAPTLILLDLMLPGTCGLEALRELRGCGQQTPVIVLTARCDEATRVRAFELGADDYVMKPFVFGELLHRVRLRSDRSLESRGGPRKSVRFGTIEVDLEGQRIYRDARRVKVRPREFTILCRLLNFPTQVVTRESLYRDVWGFRASVKSRALDFHITSLRRKIETTPNQPRHIITVRRMGYKFVP